jgi:hypothetical protein
MEISIGIIGIIIAIVVSIVISFIPYYRQKYILRPELTIEIINNGSSSSPKELKRTHEVNKNKNIDDYNIVRVFDLIWWFKIRITNNSNITAFYPKLTLNPNGPKLLLKKVQSLNKPIKPTESIELEAEYKKHNQKTKKKSTDIPLEFSNLELLLCYQNSKKSKFYTLYEFNSGKKKPNMFLKRMPKKYKNN